MGQLVKLRTWSFLLIAVTLAACGSLPAVRLTVIPSLTAGITPSQPGLPEEAILILAPGNGSRLVGQVHVEGIADSTFEQTLVIQVVLFPAEGQDGAGDGGQVLAQQPVMIQAELGQRGPFAADVPFDLTEASDQPGEVRVYAASPRDGGITHLASAQVTLAASGESDLRAEETHAERIVITAPSPAGVVAGGTAHVEGVALASFEQNLVVELYDVEGVLIGSAPTTIAPRPSIESSAEGRGVAAVDMGVPGPFAVDVAYTLAAAGPGRIVVLDPSPAFGQTLHLASVEVQIEP
ncbi:MAG: hypothetical protein HW375_2413 [Anaerolineales bacterium]|nr:hypothetical protein [Anaerolineales bacterium]